MDNLENMKISEQINDFCQLLIKSVNIYKKDTDIENEMFKEQNNLLHSLELDELTYHQIARLGKDIRDLRRSRREYKNEYILYEPIVKFINSHKDLINEINELIKDVEKVEKHLSQQKYNVRQTIDGLSTMHNDKSVDTLRKEKCISLVNILRSYTIQHEYEFDACEDMQNDICDNYVSLKFNAIVEDYNTLKCLKEDIYKIFNAIAQTYELGDLDTYEIITSDMLKASKGGKGVSLSGQMDIWKDNKLIARYVGEVSGTKKGSSEKKKKGKKRRR